MVIISLKFLNKTFLLLLDIAPINETLPFITMNIVSQVDTDENKNIVSDEQQSPLISTFEKREEVEKANIESTVLIPSASETIIPITIDVDSKPTQEPIELKTVYSFFSTIFLKISLY